MESGGKQGQKSHLNHSYLLYSNEFKLRKFNQIFTEPFIIEEYLSQSRQHSNSIHNSFQMMLYIQSKSILNRQQVHSKVLQFDQLKMHHLFMLSAIVLQPYSLVYFYTNSKSSHFLKIKSKQEYLFVKKGFQKCNFWWNLIMMGEMGS